MRPLSPEDGFFKTGDIGQLLESQAIVITDRKKDIIIRGGENLSAREIEEVVMLHPAVAEAAAVSAPHARLRRRRRRFCYAV